MGTIGRDGVVFGAPKADTGTGVTAAGIVNEVEGNEKVENGFEEVGIGVGANPVNPPKTGGY